MKTNERQIARTTEQATQPFFYEIRVRGRLSAEQWADWFDNLTVSSKGGESLLRGVLPDHAALYALLGRLRDLAVPLLAVNVLDAQAQRKLNRQSRRYTLLTNLTLLLVYLALVLDDYHFITHFAAHEMLVFLLDNLPPGLHVVIVTREDPPLLLARMRARGQITEIRERDLRFSREESSDFLNRTMSLNLEPDSVAALEQRTEGWVTGLQLAGVAIRQQSAVEQFIAEFAGDDRYIVDYVMAEVLEREPEALRHFLRQTAVLDRFCAPLCDAVTGRDDSQATLEQLDRANLFLVPLDNRREWYRYHSLFTEVLRLTLSDEEKLRLHDEAAHWYVAHGYAEMAAHHLRQSAELASARDQARQRLSQPLIEPLSERELEVLRWIDAGLSNQEIASRLFITVGTVKRHINNIYSKLEVGSRTQAIARARSLRLLE